MAQPDDKVDNKTDNKPERRLEPSLGKKAGEIATVLELLPQGAVQLELQESRVQVIAHPAAASQVNFTRLRPKDKVLVELSPHDRSRGRIIKLLADTAGV